MKPIVNNSLWLLNAVGVDPFQNNKIKIVTALLMYIAEIVPLGTDVIFDWKGKLSFEGAADLIVIWQVFFKYFILVLNRNRFANILKLLEQFWPLHKFDMVVQQEVITARNLLKTVLRIFKLAYWTVGLLYVCKPLLLRRKILITSFYIPSVDAFSSPIYEFLYLQEIICSLIGLFTIIGFDTLFVCLVFHVIIELRLIKKGFASIPVSDSNFGDNEEGYEQLKVLVNHHSKVLGFVKQMSDCYSLLVLNQFVTSTMCICGALLILSSNGSSLNPVIMAKYGTYLLIFMAQMLCYCGAGSFISEESQSVANAIYDSKWWMKPQRQLRRGLVLSILRSHKAVQLTGAGMFKLDFKLYTTIIKTGMSLFTLFRTVYAKSEE